MVELSSMNDTFHDRRLVIDLDGTICEQTAGGAAYWKARPKQDVIDTVNSYYNSGWYVTVHTARGMRSCNGDIRLVKALYEEKTHKWLVDHGVHYHQLIMGKPAGDRYVDDRGVRPDEFVR